MLAHPSIVVHTKAQDAGETVLAIYDFFSGSTLPVETTNQPNQNQIKKKKKIPIFYCSPVQSHQKKEKPPREFDKFGTTHHYPIQSGNSTPCIPSNHINIVIPDIWVRRAHAQLHHISQEVCGSLIGCYRCGHHTQRPFLSHLLRSR